MTQPRSRHRHEKILDAALRVFARKGYRDAAVDDIAIESRTSKGGVYFHFPGKQAIFLELLNRTAARLRTKIEEAMAAEPDPVRRADAALLVVLRTFASHRALARLFMIEALGAGKEFHQRLSQIHEEFASIIKDQLDEAVRRGVIEPLDTRVAATAWFGALNEVMTSWLLAQKPGRLQETYDALRPLLMRSVGVPDAGPRLTFEEDLRQRLDVLLERARAAARDGGRPVLASLTVPCPDFDPVAVFAAAGERTKTFWQQPDAGVAMVSLGVASRVELTGGRRFADARRAWRDIVGRSVTEPSAAPFEAPVATAAFAFAPRDGGGRGRPWQGFPDAVLSVPRLMFLKTPGSAWLVVSRLVDSTAHDAEDESAQHEVVRLLQANARFAAAGAVCHADTGDAEAWMQTVASAIADMRAGGVEKVVLARAMAVHSPAPFDVPSVLERLVSRYRACTVFAFAEGGAVFAGATPERLLRIQDGIVSVDCLAGSIGRGADETEDRKLASQLLHDPKELHEHRVVASAIEEALLPLCADLQVAPTPRIVSFANIHHLYTPVTGTALPGVDIFEFVERLHPTPAMGGQPREAALALIDKYETFDRGWYAAPVGWLDAAGNGDFAVAIRSALLRGSEGTLFAGNGIVAESEPEREYEETNLKLKAMLWALGQD
jgi:isochorismate synthase